MDSPARRNPAAIAVLRRCREATLASDYLKRIEAIKNCVRRMAITSDIIVGFPGETMRIFRTLEIGRTSRLYGFTFSNTRTAGHAGAKLDDDVSGREDNSDFSRLEQAKGNFSKGSTSAPWSRSQSSGSNGAVQNLKSCGTSTCHRW